MARYTIIELQQTVAELQASLNAANERTRLEIDGRKAALIEQADRHEKELTELRKQVESEKRNYQYANERAGDYKGEIDAAHALIDAIDCPLPRRSKKNPDDYSETENSLVLRIGAWLAKKAGMGVK